MAQERSFRVGKGKLGRMTNRRLLGIGANFLNQGSKLFHDVFDGFDKAGTVTDQAMAAPAGQAVGRARDREDFAILFHGVRRGRERPAARGRFDDQDTKGQPGDDPVALGEQAGQRTLPHRHLADQGAGLDLSPALRDYLGLSGMDRVDWQFVEEADVPPGPWRQTITRSGIDWK